MTYNNGITGVFNSMKSEGLSSQKECFVFMADADCVVVTIRVKHEKEKATPRLDVYVNDLLLCNK